MYDIEKCYVSLMLACKHPQNDNVKHCVARITGMDKKHISDRTITGWLSRAVEAFRPYAKSISSQGVWEMTDYLEKYDYIYKPKYDNQYQRVNQWMIHLLRDLKVREQDENGKWVDKYPYM